MLDEINEEKLIERLVSRIERTNTELLKDIAWQISTIGRLNPTKAKQVAQILKYGGKLEEIASKLSKMTNLNINEIYEIFDKEAVIIHEYSRKYYEARGLEFVPYEKNTLLQQQVKAIADATAGRYMNLSQTLAFVTEDKLGNKVYNSISQTYINAIDEAVMSLEQGKETFQASFERTIRELSESGIQSVEYASGYHKRLDTAVRMNLTDGLHNLMNSINKIQGEEFNADGVEISVHTNSAPDHEDVQGHQFSLEEFDNFQNDKEATDYKGKKFAPEKHGKDRRSIGQYNCYHDIFYIVLGVQEPNYSDKELEEIKRKNNKGFDIGGKHYTNYEGTQLQRKLELKIRKEKDKLEMATIGGEEFYKDLTQKRIRTLNKRYKELSKLSGLPTKVERLKNLG